MTQSVFDTTSKMNHMTASAFLDPNGGVLIQRYDMMRYRQFDRLTQSQLGFFWRPEEVELTKDSSDFKGLTDFEKHIFTSNLKRQILLDSVQGRSPNLAFLPIVSLPEIEGWITLWAFNEMIHSRSYTHIIRNVYADPSKIFDEITSISEIVDCAKDISVHYDHLVELSGWYRLLGVGTHVVNDKTIIVDMYQLKKALYMALMSVNILEGLRFFVSFACSWAFAELKKMEGNAKIIKLICMPADHEILTETGWKKFPDLTKTEKVAQYNTDGTIEFVYPTNYIEEEYAGDVFRFKNKSGYFDVSYTPDHRVIFRENGIIKESTAEKFNPACTKQFITSGKKIGVCAKLSDLERFRIAVQADGCISDRYDGSICGTIPIDFHLKKQRKIIRLIKIIEDLRFSYKISPRQNGFIDIKVNVPTNISVTKDFNWINLSKIDYKWAQEFLEELMHWDGHLRYRNHDHMYYSTISSECADTVQAVATLSGYRSYRGIQIDDRKHTYNDVHRITFIPSEDAYNCGDKRNNKRQEYYKGKVYCVSVPSGMIVIRHNNQVLVTGNCRDENLHLATTQLLLKLLVKDDPDYVRIAAETQDACVALYRDATTQEMEWARFLFKDGSMIGLNEHLLCEYVEYIANKRLSAIGLPTIYKTGSNPLPWTQKWISGSEVQDAPQEVEISSYVIGGVHNDMTNDTFKGFSL